MAPSPLEQANFEIKETQSQLIQSAKMISLGQVVAGVAHELNNPIGYIYSNMHHLLDYVKKIETLFEQYQQKMKSLPKQEKEELEQLEKMLEIDFILKDMRELTHSCVEGAKRTKEIVLGLRTFSRTEEKQKGPADIHEGIKSTLKLLSSELKDRIEIHEDYAELPPIDCYLTQINQVLMNLLVNASQSIQKKGDIWIKTFRDKNSVCIEIKDNGSGIESSEIDKIFDPFFTTKKIGEGTGLGLSIAYNIVKQHGGHIEVTSTLGVGTVFQIYLPII